MFTCETNITQTITNTGTATGHANGFTAVDYSPATVVVSPPLLPNTGIGSDNKSSSPWNILILAGTLSVVSASFIVMLRKRTI